MNQRFIFELEQPVADLLDELPDEEGMEHLRLQQELVEVSSRAVLHDEVAEGGRLVDVVQSDDVSTVKLVQVFYLPAEDLPGLLPAHGHVVSHFHAHDLMAVDVLPEVHHTRKSTAQLGVHLDVVGLGHLSQASGVGR